jgi:uncharacterized protein with GYD domain
VEALQTDTEDVNFEARPRARARAFAEAAATGGVKVEAQYWTVGSYDSAVVLSADSERKVQHALTELAAAGDVRSETLQAFDEKEFEAIVRG